MIACRPQRPLGLLLALAWLAAATPPATAQQAPTADTRVVRAVLHVRPIGGQAFREIDIEPGDGGRLGIDLPPELLVAPGVEYFVEWILDDGRRQTFPGQRPTEQPYQVRVEPPPDRRPVLRLIDPDRVRDPNEPIRIEISGAAPLSPDAPGLRVLLDEVDVSGLVQWSADAIVFEPQTALSGGPHRLKVESDDPSAVAFDVDFVFEVAAGARPAAEFYAQGGIAAQFGLNAGPDGPDDQLTASLGLAFGGRYADTDLAWNGININYVKDAAEPLTVSSGFHFSARRGQQLLEYGDLSVNETPLTVSGFSRRGVQARLHTDAGELHLFGVSTSHVDGFSSGLSDNLDDQVVGASFARPLLPDGRLTVKVVGLTGGNQGAGSNTASVDGPASGDTVGVQLNSTVGATRLAAELAWSRYDDDLSDAVAADTDSALRLDASRGFALFNLSAGYLRYGTDYATIANPNFSGDREGVNLGLSTGSGPYSLSASLDRLRDNLDDDPTRPVVTSTGGSISLGYAEPGIPTLQASYAQARQQSSDEPVGDAGVDNLNSSLSLTVAHGGETWSSAFSASFGELDDRLASNNDSDTQSYDLSASLRQGQVNISPGVSYSDASSAGVGNRSQLVSVNLSLPLRSGLVNLSSQLSAQHSWATDDSSDATSIGGGLRLSWDARTLMRRWFGFERGSPQLSISLDHNRQRDDVAGTDNSETRLFLSLGYSVPLEYRKQWP